MARATTKADLISGANSGFEKLNHLIDSMTEKERSTAFDFSKEAQKKEAHWARDKTLRDIYAHLYEWHQLLLNWIHSNMQGDEKPFLPAPYNWKSYGDMNMMFWERHRGTPLERAKELFQASHKDVIALAETFDNDALFSKGAYKWVGASTLGSYFISATASHYDWAVKKLKAHIKNCKADS